MRHGAPVAKAKSEYQYHIRHNLSSGRIDKSRRVALFVPAYLVRSRRVRYSGVCQEQLKQGACGLNLALERESSRPDTMTFPVQSHTIHSQRRHFGLITISIE